MNPHNRRPRPVDVGGASSNSERAAIDGIDAPQVRLSGLYSTFVDDMADGVAFHSAIRDDTGHIVDFLLEGANQAFGRLVDRAHDELVGRRMLELFPTWADGLFDACVQAVETGEPQAGESLPEQPGLQWANANGRTPSVEISISKLGDGCAISLRDVTARQRVDDELFRSQAMLRSVLDTFPQRVFWKDLNSTFIGCNAAFGRNIGLADPSEIVGIDDFRIHAHDDAERYRADDREIMRSGLARIEYEEPMTRTDGIDGWARTSKVPIRDKDGQIIGLLGAYQDITDQKRAQEALRKSEGFLNSIVENIPDMVFVKDARDLRFVRFNRAGEELLGYTREELTGKSDHDLFPQHEADFFTQKDREVLRGRQVFDIPEETIQTRYQGERVLHTKKIPMVDEGGNPEYLLGISEDITERKRAEEELRAVRQRFADIIEFLPDATFVIDADKHVIAWNRAIEEMTGTLKEDILGTSDYAWAVPWYGERRPLLVDLLWPENIAWTDRYDFVDHHGDTLYAEVFVPRLRDGKGAYVWVTASPLRDAAGNFAGAIESVRDITARKRAEKSLQESEERYRALHADIPSMYFTVDAAGTVKSVNTFGASQLGYTVDELVGGSVLRVFPPDQQAEATGHVAECLAHPGEMFVWELRKVRQDGSQLDVRETARAVPDQQGQLIVLIVCEDVTERNVLQAQLRQSQKMEAVGQLAGGIAHDFNNLITAIRGFSEFVRESLPPGDRDDIDQVVLAADRAAELTRQLLAFSRRQVLQPLVLGPAEIVEGIAPMLGRLLGEHIELVVQAAPDVGRIRVDPTGLEQIIVNLAVNARDAMPGGGRLVIETTNAEIDVRSEQDHAEMTPGPYVVLRVTDTGCGMDEETRARVFEPFFTTKEPGSGTGMGLATVYGIVRQSGGQIYLESELGHGTTFAIYLPRVDQEAIAAAVATEAGAVPRGSETILLVEDEWSVRTFARRALEGLGYTVLEAANGAEAAALAAEHTGRIDLVVTDVVMPRMGGRELAERLRSARPDLAILFMSGFSGNAVGGADLIPPGAPVLAKPFTREGLGRAVREALAAAE